MFKIKNKNNARGAALVEYGILVGAIAVVAIGSVTLLGEEVDETFNQVTTTLQNEIPGPATTTGGTGGGTGGVTVADVGPPLPDPATCELIERNMGAVDGDSGAYAGVTCFDYAGNVVNENMPGDDFVTVTTNANYVFTSGTNGMSFDSGEGDDLAYFNQGACARSFPGMFGGSNEIIVQNHASTDAYFNSIFGNLTIDFADGSGIMPYGNITAIHFTDTTLDNLQILNRSVSDSAAPENPACGGGTGGGGDFGGDGEIGFGPAGDYTVLDGCVALAATGEYQYCPGGPTSLLPADLEFRPRNGQQCAYDPAISDFVQADFTFVEPDRNDGLSCY
jgi:pilus assembly protein Flp/PilA